MKNYKYISINKKSDSKMNHFKIIAVIGVEPIRP